MTKLTFSEISNEIPSHIQHGETRILESLQTIKTRTSNTILDPLICRLIQLIQNQQGALSPWVFLGYYRLGETLSDKEETTTKETIKILSSICDLVDRQPIPHSVVSFGDNDYATKELWSYLLEVLQDGGSFPDDLAPSGNDTFRSIEKNIKQTHQFIETVDPKLKTLMGTLQGLIIAGKPGIRASLKKQNFGGATCFFFRGGTVINSTEKISMARMVERLIHEYAHAELFTISQKELLCLNSDEQTYPVLIRSDPRPMNGIIHSLYVVCRVADFQLKIVGNKKSSMNKQYLTETKKILSEQLAYGGSSLKTLRSHANLTPLGDKIVGLCENFLSTTQL